MLCDEVKKYKDKSIPYQINQLRLMMSKSFNRVLKKCSIDLTPEQMQLLGLLLEKDAFFMHEISNELMVDNSAITRLVDALEKKKFVSRKVSKQDRRLRVVAITESGKNEICKAKDLTEMHKEIMVEGISATEQDKFMDTLRKMKSNMEQSYEDDFNILK